MAASAVLEGPREIPSIDKAQIIADTKEVGKTYIIIKCQWSYLDILVVRRPCR